MKIYQLRQRLLLLCIAFVLSGCSGCTEHDRSNEASTLNRGVVSGPDSLDPHKNSTTQGHKILLDLFEGLLRHSATGELEGGMAREWSASADGQVYTFELHQDALWSNGDPLTAHDFEYSFKRLVDPNMGAFYAAFLSVIEGAPSILNGESPVDELGVNALSDSVFEVRLSRATPYFPQLLTHPATAPLHRSSVEQHGSDFARPGKLVSNGAYVLQEQDVNSVIRLVKNAKYREANSVAIERVNYFIIEGETSMYNWYRAGELDITGTVPTAQFEEIAKTLPDELKVAPMLGVYYYGFNMTKPPFGDNLQLRKALSLAVDREQLVQSVTRRGELPAFSWVPPGIQGYKPAVLESSLLPYSERIELARKLYSEAGFSEENPATFELRYNVGDGETRIAVALQSMWKQALGAEATLVNEEFGVLLSNIRQKAVTELYRLSWIGDYFDPHTFLELMISTNPSNLTGYSNLAVDKLMSQAADEIDVEKRMALLRNAETIVLRDSPIIPLYFYVSKHLVKSNVQGWHDTTLDFHPSRHLSLSTANREQ